MKKIVSILSSILCVEIAVVITFLLMLLCGPSFLKTISEFGVFLSVGFSYYGFLGVVKKILALSAPMICCSLAVILPFKTGIFNIGVTNQFMFASLGTLFFAIRYKMYVLSIIAGSVFGMLIALVPVILKIYFHVNEIISGILLNFIILNLINYIYKIFLMDMVNVGDGFKTFQISNVLPGSTPGSNFSYAFVLVIILAVLVHFFLEKTTTGFSIKSSGYSYSVSTCVGIDVKKNMLLTMLMAGFFAGLGASIYYLSGIEEWCIISQSAPSFPANGIVAAFLSFMNPISVLLTAALISFFKPGAIAMNQSFFPKEFGNFAIAIIIYMLLFHKQIQKLFCIGREEKIQKQEENNDKKTSKNEIVNDLSSSDSGDNSEIKKRVVKKRVKSRKSLNIEGKKND